MSDGLCGCVFAGCGLRIARCCNLLASCMPATGLATVRAAACEGAGCVCRLSMAPAIAQRD